MPTEKINQLRAHMRTQRRQLTPEMQQQAASYITTQLLNHTMFTRSKNIGVYLSGDGEINLYNFINKAWKLGKNCYLPCIQPNTKQINFALYTPDSKLAPNQYNILEPTNFTHNIPASQLDLVVVPTVAFDNNNNRIGRGGGYYDYTFAFIKQKSNLQTPYLIGIATALQKIDTIDAKEWDIKLNQVIYF